MMKTSQLRQFLYLANTVMICVVLLALTYLTFSVVEASRHVKEFNEQQVNIVQQQNDLQLCTQHDLTIAVRKIGRKLGLPVDDISIPNVEEIPCDELQTP